MKRIVGIILFVSIVILVYRIPFIKYDLVKKNSKIKCYTNSSDTLKFDSVLDVSRKRFSELDMEIPSANIFLTQNNKEFSVFALYLKRNAFAITKPFSKKIFFAPSNIRENYCINSCGDKRSLSGVLSHELTHIYLNKQYGLIKILFKPEWKIEGICEFVSNDSSFDISEGIEIVKKGGYNKGKSYEYFQYRLFIDYLIEVKGMNISEIMQSKIDVGKLQKTIQKDLATSSYQPFH